MLYRYFIWIYLFNIFNWIITN